MTISLSHRPLDLRQWARMLQAFFEANKLDQRTALEQTIYARLYVETELDSRIELRIDDQTVAYGNQNSILSFVQAEFNIKYPLFERRLEYFRYSQQPGQSASSFLTKKVLLSYEADLPTLQVEEMNSFLLLAGLRDESLLTKLLDLKKPSFTDLRDRISRYEATKASQQACQEAHRAHAAQGSSQQNFSAPQTQQQPQQKRMVTPWSLNGLCRKCGSKKHATDQCGRENLVCKKCNKPGHTVVVCLQDYFKTRDGKAPPRARQVGSLSGEPSNLQLPPQPQPQPQPVVLAPPSSQGRPGTGGPQAVPPHGFAPGFGPGPVPDPRQFPPIPSTMAQPLGPLSPFSPPQGHDHVEFASVREVFPEY